MLIMRGKERNFKRYEATKQDDYQWGSVLNNKGLFLHIHACRSIHVQGENINS